MKNNTMIPYNPKKDLETNYYNKTEVELLVAGGSGGSIDLSNYYKKLETYSKAQVDALVAGGGADLSDYYTKAEVDGLLDSISLDDYYTKTQTEVLLSNKVEKEDGKGLSTNDFTNTFKQAYDGHLASTSNPHNVTALQVGAYSKSENDNLLDKKANLDLNNKIPLSEIPDSILGQLKYMGVWDFSSGFPTGAQKGNYWITSVSGNGYEVGDWAVYNGTSFDKVDNTDAVSSVAGRTGNVVLNKNDVGLNNVDNTSDLNKPISTATQTALNNYILLTEKGSASGVAPLDAAGKVDTSYLPTFTSDVNSVNGYTGVVVLTKSDVGLSAVDNTSDIGKPISTAAQTALDGKSDTSHTHNYAGSVSVGGPANSVAHINVVKFDTGLNEGTDKYTFDGSADTVVDIKAGTNISLTKVAGAVTINSTSSGITNLSTTYTANDITIASDTGDDSIILAATDVNAGVMSSSDKTKLDSITVANLGTVTSVGLTVPTGLTVSNSPITTAGTLGIGFDTGYSIPTTANQTNWNTAYSNYLNWDGGSTNLVASTGRTSLGATTLGSNLFTLTNVSEITYPRFNADNTVSALNTNAFITAIGAIASTEKGSASGVAPLNASSKIDSSYLPVFTSDVTSVNGQTGVVTIPVPDVNTTIQGNTFNGVNQLVKLDATGKLPAIDGSQLTGIISSVTSVNGYTGTVILTKSDIGLANVDNTSDLNKPISTATQTALNGKQDNLVSGTSIKTINGQSVLGNGNIEITGDTGNGIVNILFTSTTDTSGLVGQSGATDTYTITYSDNTTDIIKTYNGLDGGVQSAEVDAKINAKHSIAYLMAYSN